MATFVIAHGAWSAGWAWKKMRPLMQARGHNLFTPTYTAIGERTHLAKTDVSLSTHVADILGVLEYEDLSGIVLVGHSYGGMVATVVADRAAGRIAHLVYLDAFVPRDGQAIFDLVGPETVRSMREGAKVKGEGWRVPPNPLPPDTPEADVAWALPRRVMQPIGTFEEAARLTGAVERLPRSYIYCRKTGPGDMFAPFAKRAQSEAGWSRPSADPQAPHLRLRLLQPDRDVHLVEHGDRGHEVLARKLGSARGAVEAAGPRWRLELRGSQTLTCGACHPVLVRESLVTGLI